MTAASCAQLAVFAGRAARADPCKVDLHRNFLRSTRRRRDSCKLRSSYRLTDQTQSTKMASWREVARPLRQLRISQIPRRAAAPVCARRWYSAEATAAAPVEESPFDNLEPEPSLGVPGPTPEQEKGYATPEPWKRAKDRKYELPASRYVLPLHPKALASFDRAPPNGGRVRYAGKLTSTR